MAGSQNKASSSMNSKENNLLLDLDIGKDFLKSWKSISLEDDAMDFDIAPVSKGKKKIFSFDKVDVDFNLDGDFGKISSFNMDISDLDVSSPPGREPKLKEKLNVISSHGDVKKKSDHFTFAFDFNELESFNFEPSLGKGPNALENKENFESSPDETGFEDKEDTSNMNMIENTNILVMEPEKPSVPGTAISIDVDSQVDAEYSLLSRTKYPSVLPTSFPGISNMSTTIGEGASDNTNTSSEPATSTRRQPKISQSEKLISSDRVDLEASVRNDSVPDLSPNTLANNEPRLGNSSNFPDKVCLMASAVEQDVNMPSVSTSCFNECTNSGNSYQLQRTSASEKNKSEKIQDGIEIHVIEHKEMIELGQVVSLVENSCVGTVISGQVSDISSTSNEDQTTVSVIQKLVPVSEATDNSVSAKQAKPRETCSMPSLQTVKVESYVQKESSTQTLLSNKKENFTPSLIDGTRESYNNSSDRKLALPSFGQLKISNRELPRKWSQEGCKELKISGEGSQVDGINYERKTSTSASIQNMEAVKLKPSLRQREQSMRGLGTLRSYTNQRSHTTFPSLTMEISRKTSQSSGDPTILSSNIASFPTIKNTPAREDKTLAIEVGQTNSDLLVQKDSSLNLDSSEYPILKGVNTLADAGKNNVVSRKKLVTSNAFVDTQKQTLGTLSLKRKTVEEHNTVLTIVSPPKRLCPSPKEKRSFAETSAVVPHKQVSNHDNVEEDHCIKTTTANCKLSMLDTSHELNFEGLEMSFSMESDANIKKAEAYSKQLDNICNMLRKKHEEAKEILVRSVVTSNKLLLLNDPLRNLKIDFKCSPV